MVKARQIRKEKKTQGLLTDLFDPQGKVVGKVTLPKDIFGAKVNQKLMAQAVRVYLTNQRQGTASVKTRGQVVASTRKIWRQKGTGRARHGAKSAPLFVGGGIAHGPKPRDFSLKLSKKMKKKALFSALTGKFNQGLMTVITGLGKIKPKTHEFLKVLENLKLLPSDSKGKNKNLKLLLILPGKVENLERAARNIGGVKLASANLINTYLILATKRLLVMEESLEFLRQTFCQKVKEKKS